MRPRSSASEHPNRRDLPDLRLGVHRVGQDACLRAGERDGLVAEVVHRHRDERARDALPGREQHVELARVRVGRRAARQLEQRVGRLAHRGDRSHDADAPLARLDEPPRDVPDLLGVGDRRAAELHDDGLCCGLGGRVHRRDCGWLVGLSLPRAAQGDADRARLRRALARPRALARRTADALRAHGARLVRPPDLGDSADHRARLVLHDVVEDARRPRRVRLPQPLGSHVRGRLHRDERRDPGAAAVGSRHARRRLVRRAERSRHVPAEAAERRHGELLSHAFDREQVHVPGRAP